MTADDIVKVLGALTVFLAVTLPAFYLTVGRPFLGQIKDLIAELRANTAATNTSATAATSQATATAANTEATHTLTAVLPTAPVTVNVTSDPPAAPVAPAP